MADRAHTPVIAGLVYPAHILYCPPSLTIANLLLSAGAAVLAGIEPLIMIVSIPVVHITCAVFYLRDPYMIGLIRGFWRARQLPFRRTRNRIPSAGNKYVA